MGLHKTCIKMSLKHPKTQKNPLCFGDGYGLLRSPFATQSGLLSDLGSCIILVQPIFVRSGALLSISELLTD
jgi:hypothetical protein